LFQLEEKIKENIVNEKEENYIRCAGNSVGADRRILVVVATPEV